MSEASNKMRKLCNKITIVISNLKKKYRETDEKSNRNLRKKDSNV